MIRYNILTEIEIVYVIKAQFHIFIVVSANISVVENWTRLKYFCQCFTQLLSYQLLQIRTRPFFALNRRKKQSDTISLTQKPEFFIPIYTHLTR